MSRLESLEEFRYVLKNNINTSALDELEEVYRVLDDDLRPLTPDKTNSQSKEIFEEHKLLAREYLRVQTDVALVGQCKRDLVQNMSKKEITDKLEIQKLKDEKESLVKLYCNLKRQLEIMKRPESAIISTPSPAVSIPREDGWVLVPCQEPSRIS